MDPKATLKAIRDAIEAGETDEAAELAGHLRSWLRRGGFVPAGLDPMKVAGPTQMVLTLHGRFPVQKGTAPC